MGIAFKELFKLLWDGGSSADSSSVAFIADRYFFFEESKFPRNSLSRKEIAEMVKITLEGMLPAGNHETVSGFFLNSENSAVTTFVASKVRLLSEIPELKSCKYWVPERFFGAHIDADTTMPPENACTVFEIDSDSTISVKGKKIRLFSDQFWNAEAHDRGVKDIHRVVSKIGNAINKVMLPLLSATAVMVLIAVILASTATTTNIRYATVKARAAKVEKIIERGKLRNEVMSFASGKSSFFKRLNVVNTFRPSKLIFKGFSMQNSQMVSLNGICDSMSTLNTFINRLKGDSRISSVSSSDTASSQNGTTFSLQIEFL
jgi:hypothetical protein